MSTRTRRYATGAVLTTGALVVAVLGATALTSSAAAASSTPLARPLSEAVAPAGGDILAAAHTAAAVCALPAPGVAGCLADVVTDQTSRPLATTSYRGGFSPAQLRSAYQLAGLTGTATIAVVDAYASPTAKSDLAVYRKQFALGTASYRQVNQRGGTTMPRGDVDWGGEQALDLDMVSAICPTCKILYVGADSASFTDLAAGVDTAVRLGATIVSNSFGGSEVAGQASVRGSWNHPGVAITVSTGDDGYGTESPAVYPTVTAVGGTSLAVKASGARKSETVWSGTGSGCSTFEAKPAWQHDAGCGNRSVADVAAVADPNTGVAVYDSYGSTGNKNWYVYGGTSASAPIIAGVYGLGRTFGAATVPASLAYSAPKGSLFDVTSGSNGVCLSYLCTAGAGYDGPTGLGTPNGVGAFSS